MCFWLVTFADSTNILDADWGKSFCCSRTSASVRWNTKKANLLHFYKHWGRESITAAVYLQMALQATKFSGTAALRVNSAFATTRSHCCSLEHPNSTIGRHG